MCDVLLHAPCSAFYLYPFITSQFFSPTTKTALGLSVYLTENVSLNLYRKHSNPGPTSSLVTAATSKSRPLIHSLALSQRKIIQVYSRCTTHCTALLNCYLSYQAADIETQKIKKQYQVSERSKIEFKLFFDEINN